MQFDFLILSTAPIPLKSNSIIEGARIRAWNLGDRYVGISKCNRDEALAHMNDCHIAICISEFESLPRYVPEELFLGHLVLRNDYSGLKEQINPWDHSNGWLVDQNNEKDFTQIISEILDPTITSDQELIEMREISRIKPSLVDVDFENSRQKIDEFFSRN